MHKRIQQLTGNTKSTAIVSLLIIAATVFGTRSYLSSVELFDISNKLQDFVTISLSIFIEAFPFLVLGSLLASIVNTYIPTHTFEKILPKLGWLRRGAISLLGFLFPVCECGNVPLSRALMIQGLKLSEAIQNYLVLILSGHPNWFVKYLRILQKIFYSKTMSSSWSGGVRILSTRLSISSSLRFALTA